MAQSVTRRQLLTTLTAAVGASVTPASATTQSAFSQTAPMAGPPPFTPCLNMSTLRGHKLGFVKELETASKAGFRSVEVWIDSLQEYVKSGGTVADARKRLSDLGIRIENAIGFAPWIVDDETVRAKGVDQMKREMELLAQVGCKRVATPSVGAQAPDAPVIDLRKAAERYRAILELGDQTGVVPQLEMWGFSKNLSRLSDVMYVAIESGHPSARLLLDIYHIFKGGSSIDSLPLIGKPGIEVFHVNDYPANMTRQAIVDADRVYPGDGVAPIKETLTKIKDPSKSIILSLEVFNKNYYAQDAMTVAKTSMEKMKKMIAGV
ncbi:sugar phosphate isomerase/epimerase [Spirosoma sp. RP8]|uniref:Sugar phosphate isomerase/epimerase n=1 Tax=Spirosoma liriopis TaxID=2937440 RepID=A0ABT0HHC4_9BACT|nr:sugar phosphate isomerase/epimerase family protein [Spirosoma liriopis]MCK8491395.1 sugar phosphate isomerase/epimerase [Spirosoma liriopis]